MIFREGVCFRSENSFVGKASFHDRINVIKSVLLFSTVFSTTQQTTFNKSFRRQGFRFDNISFAYLTEWHTVQPRNIERHNMLAQNFGKSSAELLKAFLLTLKQICVRLTCWKLLCAYAALKLFPLEKFNNLTKY